MVTLPLTLLTVKVVNASPSVPVSADMGERAPKVGSDKENSTCALLISADVEPSMTCTVMVEVIGKAPVPSLAISHPVLLLVIVEGERSAARAVPTNKKSQRTTRIVRFTLITHLIGVIVSYVI